MDMFQPKAEVAKEPRAPLATRMRPPSFETFIGQEHIVGKGRVLRKAIESGKVPSLILWGPTGCGKTTLAHIIAHGTGVPLRTVSAVSAGVADLRRVIEEAKGKRSQGYMEKIILFIDEIHRFNKAQQDAMLPFVEDGTITLIGATTENPSSHVTSPLLSRCHVLKLHPLGKNEIRIIILRALRDSLDGLGALNAELAPEALEHLISVSNGDARVALNTLEVAALTTPPDAEGKRHISLPTIEDAIQHPALHYDKEGDQHYDTISALHKSMRDSDPDAAVYWLARMLEAGEDPLYIARRLIRFASEDVGLADPQALVIAMAAQQAVSFIGLPEGNLALAEAAIYLATAPKSNSAYEAYSRAQEEIKRGATGEVPLHLRNPSTPLTEEMGYGQGYKYAHDFPGHFVEQQHLPDALKDKRYYTPGNQGYEQQISDRLKKWFPGKTDEPGKGENKGD